MSIIRDLAGEYCPFPVIIENDSDLHMKVSWRWHHLYSLPMLMQIHTDFSLWYWMLLVWAEHPSSWLCCHLTALLDKPGPLRALFSSHPGPALFNCTLSNSGASQRATKDIYEILSILAKVQILSLQNIKKMSRKKMRRTNILHLWNEWVWEWLLDLYISTQSSGETEIGADPDPAYVGAWLLPCWELESYT